ncbi:MAG TPA: spore germination protein GerW family protein [Dehalococcoidia bacterium]|jgi:uncharacterized spore protein YtfJ|nr:spore germination protein GerW family protein [Dehalococcoidia bacterium]
MTIGDVLNTITERLNATGHVKTIYGEPIVADGKTIIPVAEVKYGFGGGGGQQQEPSSREGGPEGESAGSSDASQGRSGMGGGGGISVRPVGVVEVSSTGTRYISFNQGRKIALSVLAGMVLGMIVFRRRRRS